MSPARRRPTSRASTPRGEGASTVEVNGWKIYVHPLFLEQVEALEKEVRALREADPDSYRNKKKTKLLAAILQIAFENIPQNPASPVFRQGNTLGPSYRHWCRAKFFEGRYRLFFRYSAAHKVIILAWVNDENTLRTYGSKTDAYNVFKKMLAKNRPPDSWDELRDEAKAMAQKAKRLLEGRSQR